MYVVRDNHIVYKHSVNADVHHNKKSLNCQPKQAFQVVVSDLPHSRFVMVAKGTGATEQYIKTKAGAKVKADDLLVELDLEKITAEGYDITTPVLITNAAEFVDVSGEKRGNPLMMALRGSSRKVSFAGV